MNCLQAFNYRPQTKLRKGYVFTPVCHSVHREGGVCPSACWDTHTPGQTSPQTDTPQADTPWADPPLTDTPQADTHLGKHPPPAIRRLLLQMVRILLECILVIFTRCKWDKVRCAVCVCMCNICAPCVHVWECVCVSGLPLRLQNLELCEGIFQSGKS